MNPQSYDSMHEICAASNQTESQYRELGFVLHLFQF